MSGRFTLGIEEEFQLVDRQSGILRSHAPLLLQRSIPYFGEQIKPEMLQTTIEFISSVLPHITAARKELCMARALLSRLAHAEGLALVSAGTHPSAFWWDQKPSPHPRYRDLEDEYQDVGRSVLIFGLHVHVAIADKELAMQVVNQARTWLPHLLALSSNSPFWYGRMTGIKSYRSVVWRRFPRSGMPEIFPSRGLFEAYVQQLIDLKCIDNGKKIWWDIRPHAFFDTIEFRICDMPATLEDTLGIAALCQALVAKLTSVNTSGRGCPAFSRDLIEENKWRAMRYGLDAEVLDYEYGRSLPMRDSIHELLDFVDDVVDDLECRREISYIRNLLSDPRGTGADRQIAAYNEGGMEQVHRLLIEQTMQGITLSDSDLGAKFLRYKMYEQAS